jgi:hypothetical protein
MRTDPGLLTMTESDWLTATGPVDVLHPFRDVTSDRKLRLLVVACCRRIDGVMTDSGRLAVNAAEQYADGCISDDELHAIWAAVKQPKSEVRRHAAFAAKRASCNPGYSPLLGLTATQSAAMLRVQPRYRNQERLTERTAQSILARCVFGNPFRPAAFDPRWLSETAVAVAAGIYAERAFDRLPVLADALEEAGCDHPDVLAHCRGPGPHARGCWVVDGVLGKV